MANRKMGEVKITGGYLRGRKIATPGGNTHPMGERERIALFNMIQDRIEDNYVMDLYCGGGTLGIEALSRGANFVCFLDNDPVAVQVANENLRDLDIYGMGGLTGFDDEGTGGAMRVDVPVMARTATDKYGVVIADPPYDKYEEEMVKYLPRLVLDGGILALSHPGEAPEFPGMKLIKSKQYAGAHISVYVKE